MAIQFARLQYVKRSAGQSACHKAAYNARECVHDLRADQTYDYSQRKDSAYHAVLLPEGVSERYEDLSAIWNAVEAVEKRSDAQVAKEMVLALPDEAQVSLEDRIVLTRGFVDEHFVQKGIICQVDIHEPHHDKDNNWHAHVLMPTRPCKGETFGQKARHLDVEMRFGRVIGTDKQWGKLWADYQNAYFKAQGIDLVVDPIGIIPQIHLGPVRMRGKAFQLISENEQLKASNERLSMEPAFVMKEVLLKQQSTFVRADVERYAQKHLLAQAREDFLGRFWTQKDLVLVGEDKFTSKSVLEMDRRMVRMAERLTEKAHTPVAIAHSLDLSQEQQKAEAYTLGGSCLVCIEGRAGTGKSHVMSALRLSYEEAGYKVRGMAPTNAVAMDMREKGFGSASNLHEFLFRRHNGFKITPDKEVWLVDEAGMIASPAMHELVQQAWVNRAKLILVGDERQLPSIERGGAFKGFCDRFGSVSLDEVRRQQDVEQRQLTEQLSRGETTNVLHHMQQNGTWVHHIQEGEAVQAMMDTWYQHHIQNPSEQFMILEYRQRYVQAFNEHIHNVLKARGEIDAHEVMVNTANAGWAHFSAGDTVVFRKNDQHIGVYNGMRGDILSVSEDRFVVRVDDDHTIGFDPQTYSDIQHGYAGTIHSAQGATFDRVYGLHSSFINQNLFYVACSRYRLSCHYFSYGDQDQVYKDVARLETKTLANAEEHDAGKGWILSMMHYLKDRMYYNHAFYNISDRYYALKGALITDYLENSACKGYLTLYREEQEHWPDLAGQKIQLSGQHRDLESTLRDSGVSQCMVLDNVPNRHLIGPQDRFGLLKDDKDYAHQCGLSDVQLRVRLHELEKHFGEHPENNEAMKHTQAYQALCHNEQTVRPVLSLTYGYQVTSQILYHLERAGTMPTPSEIETIQVRVDKSLDQYSDRQPDSIFVASLDSHDPAQKHAETILAMYHSRQLDKER